MSEQGNDASDVEQPSDALRSGASEAISGPVGEVTVTRFDEVLAAVQARVSYLRCTVDVDPGDGWVSCAELIADPGLLKSEIDATAPGRGTDDPQVAASLYAQAYAFRVPSVTVAAWALGLPAPRIDSSSTSVRIARHRPADLALSSSACHLFEADQLAAHVLGEHLAPFIDAVRAVAKVGERLLWGNAAASLATIFRAVQSAVGPTGDAAVRHRAEAFFGAAEPWLGSLGSFDSIEVPEALGWYWVRTNCCLWYRTTSGSYCDDCSLHDQVELRNTRELSLRGAAQ